MDRRSIDTFDGDIVAVLRSKCSGFQRRGDGLVTVVESLVRLTSGPPTVVYQLRSADGVVNLVLRSRPLSRDDIRSSRSRHLVKMDQTDSRCPWPAGGGPLPSTSMGTSQGDRLFVDDRKCDPDPTSVGRAKHDGPRPTARFNPALAFHQKPPGGPS